jgi:iron complex outermembrane receptor protein
LDDEVAVLVFVLDYKNTLFSVPFELSIGYGGGFDDYTFPFSKSYASQPIQEVLLDRIQQKQQKSSYQNYFVQADFFIVGKTSFRNRFGF